MALMRKEFHRFFHDPRLIATLLLPGIIIFALYSILGEIIYSNVEEQYSFRVYLSGESGAISVIEQVVEESGSKVEWLEISSHEEAVKAVENGDVTAYLHFSENFDADFMGATVEFYYNAKDEGESSMFYSLASSALQAYGMRFQIITHNFMSEEDLGRVIMMNLLPMLVVTLVFSACMSVTLESVAGEKERGTLTTILATSVNRLHLALGKVLSLSCIVTLGAASSFLGVVFSLPKLTGIDMGVFIGSYGIVSYLYLFLSILGLVPLIVSLIALISTYSKSVKEASGYTSVVMILIIVVSVIGSFVSEMGGWVVAVPVLNAVTVIQQVLANHAVLWFTLLSFVINLIYSAILILAISKMLSSERIVFGR